MTRTLQIICVLVAFYSAATIIFDFPRLLDVFRLADPTGAFGWKYRIGAFFANTTAVFVSISFFLQKKKKSQYICITIAFLKLLEALAWTPCLISILTKSADALCAVWVVFIANFTAPFIIILGIAYVLISGSRKLKIFSASILTVFILTGLVFWMVFTPKTPEACLIYPEATRQAACLHKFSLETLDPKLCERIEFRYTRFACFRNLAEKLRNPELCEKIADPQDFIPKPYETTASHDRDICYWIASFNAQNSKLCRKIYDAERQKNCIAAGKKYGWKFQTIPAIHPTDKGKENEFIGYWELKDKHGNAPTLAILENGTAYFDFEKSTDIIGKWRKNSSGLIKLDINDHVLSGKIVERKWLRLRNDISPQEDHFSDYKKIENPDKITYKPSYHHSAEFGTVSYIQQEGDWKHEWRFSLKDQYKSAEIVLSDENGKDVKTLVSFKDIECSGMLSFAFRIGEHKFLDNLAKTEHSIPYGYSRIANITSACKPSGVATWIVVEGGKILDGHAILEKQSPFPFIFQDGQWLLFEYTIEKNGIRKKYFVKFIFEKKT